MLIILYFIQLIILSIYSWALIDPNITLVNHPLWSRFLEQMLQLGYYQRQLSSFIYIEILAGLFVLNYYLVKNNKKFSPIKLALLTGLILIFSYPFLSHDIFNYLFDAKILTYYGQNPYLHKALDFPTDPWLRFMHWTHRSYPYGPAFLPLTLIPSFLAMGKFILNFFFFKIFFTTFYVLTVYYLNKLNRVWAIFYATSPLVIIEGLVNNHNDIIAVCFAISGIYYLLKTKRKYLSGLLLLLSAGIKYLTMPILLLIANPKDKKWDLLAVSGLVGLLIYLSITSEIQPWYWLNLFILIPYGYKYLKKINIFFFGLLLSYYPYIAIGDWTNKENIVVKRNIIIIAFIINVCKLILTNYKTRKLILKK